MEGGEGSGKEEGGEYKETDPSYRKGPEKAVFPLEMRAAMTGKAEGGNGNELKIYLPLDLVDLGHCRHILYCPLFLSEVPSFSPHSKLSYL